MKGVQGSSSCAKSKVVKRKFEDQEDTKRAQDADTADAAAATPATLPDAGTAAAFGGEEPSPVPSPGGKSLGWGNKGRAGAVSNKKAAKAQG